TVAWRQHRTTPLFGACAGREGGGDPLYRRIATVPGVTPRLAVPPGRSRGSGGLSVRRALVRDGTPRVCARFRPRVEGVTFSTRAERELRTPPRSRVARCRSAGTRDATNCAHTGATRGSRARRCSATAPTAPTRRAVPTRPPEEGTPGVAGT